MKKKVRLYLYRCINIMILVAWGFGCQAPTNNQEYALPDHEALYQAHDTYRESSFTQRRIKHKTLMALLESMADQPEAEVRQVGTSIEGKSIKMISVGDGPVSVLLWSQMHGNESTATMAIFDILNLWLSEEEIAAETKAKLKNLTIHFIPMLNPDGADRWQRRNTLGIDINRDALRLQTPEGRTLKRIRDSLDADFGFNLHDQSRYYNTGLDPLPATISVLAPAYNHAKDINEVRGNAMRVIGLMNEVLQHYIPGQVGKYDDTFEPRAFGDNIQKWGTSAILIESGGDKGDREKQQIRKLNFVAILSALMAISEGNYADVPIAAYERIPPNNRRMYDLIVRRAYYELRGMRYTIDIGINHNEVDIRDHTDFYYRSVIADQGDLSINFGYEEINASGFTARIGKVYPQVLPDLKAIHSLDLPDLLQKGISYVKVRDLRGSGRYSHYPVQIVTERFRPPDRIQPYIDATFFLEKEGEYRYAIINGFPYDLDAPVEVHTNSLIIK